MEIDVSGSNLTYQTGDHIAVWPTNAGKEVDRFVKAVGLSDNRHRVISVKGLDPTARVPFPTPTTYDAVIRYHMEICGPVSRQFVSSLAAFAPDDASKAEMTKLGEDKDYFQEKVSSQYLNIAQLLSRVNPDPWAKIPFSLFIEGVNKIQPRYYSISSSSLVQKKQISITAVVEEIRIPGSDNIVKGVTTNYLLALKQKQHGDPHPDPHGLTYAITGPRNKYDGIHVPVHVRHSNFKLPSDPSKPIIMVGPGSGVAPFRGFIQERAAQAKAGEKVGKTVLFYGCRRRGEDFLYKDEWDVSTFTSMHSPDHRANQPERHTSSPSATLSCSSSPFRVRPQARKSTSSSVCRNKRSLSTSFCSRRRTFTCAVTQRTWRER